MTISYDIVTVSCYGVVYGGVVYNAMQYVL